MNIALSAIGLGTQVDAAPWSADWMWGCPLIVLTVIVHIAGLGFVSERAMLICSHFLTRGRILAFALAMAATTLLAIILHGIEAGMWAIAYCWLGTMPDFKTAMLYSLGAMTTFGHQSLFLKESWRLMGAIEALNGWLLFGLSTAFLFWLIQQIMPKNRADC